MKDQQIEKAMDGIENRIRHIYNCGYQQGYEDGKKIHEKVRNDDMGYGYQHGLEDAWECARKIILDTGYTSAQLEEIFSDRNECNILKELSISEAMQKIKDYEERQEAEVTKAVNEGIKNISVKTGVNFYDDLQEQQTGKWIKIGNTLECPFCGAMGEDIKDDYCFNYCPNCGAKMRKESK